MIKIGTILIFDNRDHYEVVNITNDHPIITGITSNCITVKNQYYHLTISHILQSKNWKIKQALITFKTYI